MNMLSINSELKLMILTKLYSLIVIVLNSRNSWNSTVQPVQLMMNQSGIPAGIQFHGIQSGIIIGL